MRSSLLTLAILLLVAPTRETQAADSADWLTQWMDRVTAIQNEQPHWVTPLAAVTPRLEQEFRADFLAQQSPKGYELYNLGNAKGLELIPVDPIEVLINMPAYYIRSLAGTQSGFGDFSVMVKYRILSSNEAADDDIVTAFLAASFPTGNGTNGAVTSILTPTLAAGKGWECIDVQSTFGATIPLSDGAVAGNSLIWNSTLQLHAAKEIWPEIEDNYTHFMGGTNGGNTQNLVTTGVAFGRFPIHERTGFTVATGFQVATTHYYLNNHSWILSARVPF